MDTYGLNHIHLHVSELARSLAAILQAGDDFQVVFDKCFANRVAHIAGADDGDAMDVWIFVSHSLSRGVQ